MSEPPTSQTVPGGGLKQSVLSRNETLAQSVALIAPTAAPLLTIPLVFASAGNGTWLAFALSMLTIVLVALNVNHFARISCSPGSLYSYISEHMHPVWGVVAAWALLIAYPGTGTSIAAGLINYLNVVLTSLLGVRAHPLLLAAIGVSFAVWLAYRDVTISARVMLALEVGSVVLISTVAGAVLVRHGFHPDRNQLALHGVTAEKFRMGLVLAIFAFVGFESATSLGSEAKDPLHSIPRAVKWSGILAGLFFVFCAYTEVLGFQTAGETGTLGTTVETLDKSVAPLHTLARSAHLPAVLSILIDLGAVVSFFSCLLACITAAARVLFLMGEKGALHSLLGAAHASHQTPHRAVLVSGLSVFLPLGILTQSGIGAFEVYGLTGTLATLGFLTAYLLISVAAPLFLRTQRRLTIQDACISALAVIALCVALFGSLYPVPPPPYSFLPYLYLALLLGGFAWSMVLNAGRLAFAGKSAAPLDAVVD